MAVPGMRTANFFTEEYGNFNIAADDFNPYFWRFSSKQVDASVLADMQRQPPTFFTVWFGINDVLPYALAGGNGSGLKWAAISDLRFFETHLRSIVSLLAGADEAKGAIGTIPDLTRMPFFNAIRPDGLVLTEAEADSLNAQYAAYPWMHFEAGRNFFVIQDPSPPVGVRHVRPDEKLLLTIDPDSLRCFGWGAARPIGDEHVLDTTELNQIRQAVLVINEVIKTVAAENGLALVDLDGLFGNADAGFVRDGSVISYDWLFGHFFSLDGVHPTPRGQGLVANSFIQAINERFGAHIPLVPITTLRGNQFP
jgi:lysophospholipase L1-like esterase